MERRIAAVVVTFNRKKLLLECLNALKKQTRPLDAIFIIDGPSTDGTPESLRESGYIQELPPIKHENCSWSTKNVVQSSKNTPIRITYVRLYVDVGGAGGFHEGVKRAYKDGYDWIWLMDDDTEPKEDALERLLEINSLLQENYSHLNLGFLCSKVLWKDNQPHRMNIPHIKPSINNIPFNTLDKHCILLVSSCSFVSFLINRNVVKEVGLPMREFFIWGDDVEYSQRIINRGYIGVYVPKSTVIHKTKENYKVDIINDYVGNPKKYFYGVRNNLYLVKRQSLMLYLLYFAYQLFIVNSKIIKHKKGKKFEYTLANIKGTVSSLFFDPKIKYPD